MRKNSYRHPYAGEASVEMLRERFRNEYESVGGGVNQMASDRWIDRARARMKRKGTEGAFSRAAKRAGMDTCAYANRVLRDPKASAKLKRRAQFAKNTGCRKRG